AMDPGVWKMMSFSPKFTALADNLESFQNRMTQRGAGGADYLKGKFGPGTLPEITPGAGTGGTVHDDARMNIRNNKPPGFDMEPIPGGRKGGGQQVAPDEINVPSNKNKGGKGISGDENVNQEQGGIKPANKRILKQVNTHDGEHELKLTDKGDI